MDAYKQLNGVVGDTFKVEPNVSPSTAKNQVLSAKIDDDSIITVNVTDNSANGAFFFTAAKEGQTTIHLTSTDGTNVTLDIPVEITGT